MTRRARRFIISSLYVNEKEERKRRVTVQQPDFKAKRATRYQEVLFLSRKNREKAVKNPVQKGSGMGETEDSCLESRQYKLLGDLEGYGREAAGGECSAIPAIHQREQNGDTLLIPMR
jgi:hypothetical protein